MIFISLLGQNQYEIALGVLVVEKKDADFRQR